MGADCKSVAFQLRWSESTFPHQKTRCESIGFSTKCSALAEREASFGREERFAREACLRHDKERLTSLCGETAKLHNGEAVISHFAVRQNISLSFISRVFLDLFTLICYHISGNGQTRACASICVTLITSVNTAK